MLTVKRRRPCWWRRLAPTEEADSEAAPFLLACHIDRVIKLHHLPREGSGSKQQRFAARRPCRAPSALLLPQNVLFLLGLWLQRGGRPSSAASFVPAFSSSL